VGGGHPGFMHAEEALVVGEGDADGGLTLGLGVE
jgi:hypothetical protein